LQQRIQTPWTDAIPVTGQFLDHPKTKDRTLYGVVQDMEPNQA
jgi:hypothetical protein